MFYERIPTILALLLLTLQQLIKTIFTRKTIKKMRKNFILKTLSVVLAAVVLFSSCASSTMISSNPSGAKVYINGEPVGNTPYLYNDTKILGSVINVDLIKDGYEPLYTSFTRSEQVNVGAIVGGLFFLVPFLWTMEYKPTHKYELVPLKSELTNSESVTAPVQSSSKTERIKELKKLLDEKLITEKEYETRKQKILEEI
jgi:hypothetical protein